MLPPPSLEVMDPRYDSHDTSAPMLDPKEVQRATNRGGIKPPWHTTGEVNWPWQILGRMVRRIDQRFVHAARLFRDEGATFRPDHLVETREAAVLEIGCGMGLHTE